MARATCVVLLGVLGLVSLPFPARGEFDPAKYEPITQTELATAPERLVGKKFRVTDPFQFCGSDFCQIQRMKINTREYYCFSLGTVCLVRMYLKKDHPDAPLLLKLRKGNKVTAYGTFDYIGTDFKYLIVDHIVVE